MVGRLLARVQPREDVAIEEFGQHAADFAEVLVKQFRLHAGRELAFLHAANERLARAGEPNQAVHRERRSGTHAERRERAGVGSERGRIEIAQVACGDERGFDVLGGLDAGRAERLRRELHEPLIELINRGRDIGFPEVRFVGVDPRRHAVKKLAVAALKFFPRWGHSAIVQRLFG